MSEQDNRWERITQERQDKLKQYYEITNAEVIELLRANAALRRSALAKVVSPRCAGWLCTNMRADNAFVGDFCTTCDKGIRTGDLPFYRDPLRIAQQRINALASENHKLHETMQNCISQLEKTSWRN